MFKIQHFLVLTFLAVLPVACGSQVVLDPDSDPHCATEGARRCQGQQHQVCTGGVFQTVLECAPSEQCSVAQICIGRNSCGTGADLVYAVDIDGHLLSFNPRHDLHRFQVIGDLHCPAGPSLAIFGDGPAVPYSMTIDRNARVWLTYSSGEMFTVDTATAACQKTNFKTEQGGFSLFGMTFVANGEGQQSESLYIAGPTDPGSDSLNLGQIDTGSMQASNLGALQSWPMTPDLSGTGAGELFAYFPGRNRSQVAQIDKHTRAYKHTWPLPKLSGDVLGWAFSHWGGRFYIFVSTDRQGQQVNDVIRFDPTDGSHTVVIDDSPYPVIGAGVSTCAPYIIG